MRKIRETLALAVVLAVGAAVASASAQTAQTVPNPALTLWNKIKQEEEPAAQRAQAPRSQASPYRRHITRANENTVSIISGTPHGTYMAIAYDFSAVLDKPDGLRVLPIIGKGAIQNINDVLFLRGVDLGLITTNSMSFYQGENDIPGIKDRLVYIAKLFNEELHVYARGDIASLKDLTGRKVNVGEQGSGSQFTALQVFRTLGIEVEEVNLGQGDALEAMRRGEIVATVLEAGKPTRVFADLKAADGFHFLPVDYDEKLQESYYPAELTHADYPNLIPEGKDVETIAAGTVLVAYNWASDTERYQRLAAFTNEFFANLDAFRLPPRHPKWAEVSLLADVPGLKRFAPAQKLLDDRAREEARKVEEERARQEARKAEEEERARQQAREAEEERARQEARKLEDERARQAAEEKNEEDRLRKEFDAFLIASDSTGSDDKAREQLFRQFLEWRRGGAR